MKDNQETESNEHLEKSLGEESLISAFYFWTANFHQATLVWVGYSWICNGLMRKRLLLPATRQKQIRMRSFLYSWVSYFQITWVATRSDNFEQVQLHENIPRKFCCRLKSGQFEVSHQMRCGAQILVVSCQGSFLHECGDRFDTGCLKKHWVIDLIQGVSKKHCAQC